MTLSEKIFAMHDMEQKGSVKPGELIRIHVDWVIASELSWGVCHGSAALSHTLADLQIGDGENV